MKLTQALFERKLGEGFGNGRSNVCHDFHQGKSHFKSRKGVTGQRPLSDSVAQELFFNPGAPKASLDRRPQLAMGDF